MLTTHSSPPPLYCLWDAGQRHLAALRYLPARSALEAAEALAFGQRDARSLARLYLPLLEARRQIRYQAAEGVVLIASPHSPLIRTFFEAPTATWLLRIPATRSAKASAIALATKIEQAVRRTGRCLEMLLILDHGNNSRLTSASAPTFAAGLPVQWTTNAKAALAASTDPTFTVPLPPPGRYTAGPLHALARESLLIAWEALALRWQHRHPPHGLSPWEEIDWLRRALQIDPACEPITMRLIALAEAIDRQTS